MTEGKERLWLDTVAENFYYTYFYDTLQEPSQHTERSTGLHKLKTKIIRQHTKGLEATTLDSREPTMYLGKNPSLIYQIQGRKNRDDRMIKEIRNENGNLQTNKRVYW